MLEALLIYNSQKFRAKFVSIPNVGDTITIFENKVELLCLVINKVYKENKSYITNKDSKYFDVILTIKNLSLEDR